jgi:DNA repair protein SbcD/Mre11
MMKTVKFLHCADLHLDMPFSTLGASVEKSGIRRQGLKEAFGKIIDAAKEEEVDLLLISGDLYEHNYVKKSTIDFINGKFKEIPDIKVFIVPGNHDPYLQNSYYKNYSWSKNVNILTGENPYVYLDELDTYVHGVGFGSFFEEKSLINDIKPVDSCAINILLIHGTVDFDFKQSSYNPMTSENLSDLGMDYVALGHFHAKSEKVGGKSNIYNPGSPEPLGLDEIGDHGIFIGTLTKTGAAQKNCEIRFMKLNTFFYESLELNITGSDTDEQVTYKVLEALKEKKCENGLFCITLKGYVQSGFKVNIHKLQYGLSNKMFYLKLIDETNIDYNFNEIKKELGLKGLFTRKIFMLLEKTEDEIEKKLLMKALYYGIEALEQGRIDL